jgi:nucleotide-binding universal stress UspA family protein
MITNRLGGPRGGDMPAVPTIMHPTDFSELSMNAFAHALRISVAVKGKLYLLHVAENQTETWDRFPHVRRTLAGWGLFDEKESPTQLTPKLGVEVIKVEVEPQHPAKGLAHFLASHESDLVVLATHSREGVQRWFRPSVAEAMARQTIAPSLFISPGSRGFVDPVQGAIRLKRVLVPVDHRPPAAPALRRLLEFCRNVSDEQIEYQLVHFGDEPPKVDGMRVRGRKESDIVNGILQAAVELGADLIAMATAGHQGVLDALRGSTTERVIRQAPCPVLAIPALTGLTGHK